MNRKKESSQEYSADVSEERSERTNSYPFAFVLRMRVVQIVCGISTLLMGSVAAIEEKGHFNMGIGIPTGVTTVLAAANSIYSSRGFDGYQPSTCKVSSPWTKFRFLGPTIKTAAVHVVLWGLATVLLFALTVNAVQTIATGSGTSVNISILAVIELLLTAAVFSAMAAALWVDIHYDPD